VGRKAWHMEKLFNNNLPKVQSINFGPLDIKWSRERHIAVEWEMIYVVKGKVRLEIGSKLYIGKPGSIFLVPAGRSHLDHISRPESYYRCIIIFKWNKINIFAGQISNEGLLELPFDIKAEISKILTNMWKEFKDGKAGFRSIINIEFCKILVLLARYYSKDKINNAVSILSHQSAIIAKVQEYIENNYQSPLTLKELAYEANISPFYLSHLFAGKSGFSPYRYLIMIRIRKAKELMEKKNMLMKEIANEVGFEDPNYFGKAFKKVTGYTPKKYLKILSK